LTSTPNYIVAELERLEAEVARRRISIRLASQQLTQ
jgi:hypothetical protein